MAQGRLVPRRGVEVRHYWLDLGELRPERSHFHTKGLDPRSLCGSARAFGTSSRNAVVSDESAHHRGRWRWQQTCEGCRRSRRSSLSPSPYSVSSSGRPPPPLPRGPRHPDPHAAPQRILIDTDLSLWWNDATAIGMANVLEQRGTLRILGIVSDIRNPEAVPAIDAIDSAYGHPNIPLGAGCALPRQHGASRVLRRARQSPPALDPLAERSSRSRPPSPDVVGSPTRSQRHHRCHRRLYELGRSPAFKIRTGQLNQRTDARG